MLLRTAQEDLCTSTKLCEGNIRMAAQAKSIREVRKDDLEQVNEEVTEAMKKVTDKTLRTNVLRTLETRRTSLIKSYYEWHRACADYSMKVASSVTSEQKKEDASENIKPVKKEYLEALDKISDEIEFPSPVQ